MLKKLFFSAVLFQVCFFTGCQGVSSSELDAATNERIMQVEKDKRQWQLQYQKLDQKYQDLLTRTKTTTGDQRRISDQLTDIQSDRQRLSMQVNELVRVNESLAREKTRLEQQVAELQSVGSRMAGAGSASAPRLSVEQPGGQYVLRLCSLPNSPKNRTYLEGVKSELLAKGIVTHAAVKQSGNYLVIDVGSFNSIQSSDANAFRQKMRNYVHKGAKSFTQAYFRKR